MSGKNTNSSSDAASAGGIARASRLTAAERAEGARKAALARWLRATHAGDLRIGPVVIPAAVLEDGRRVLTQEGFLEAIGRAKKAKGGQGASVDELPAFLAAKNLNRFVSADLRESTRSIPYRTLTGGRAFGYRAELLTDVCKIYLRARREGALASTQEHIAAQCEILMEGLATVGIVALVDEATGYQAERDRDELHQILEKYISKELLPWTRRFPDEFYRQIYRLMGWQYPRGTNHPWFVGKATKAIVYKRLPPGVLEELEKHNPADAKGARKHKHHQWLSEDFGSPHLRDHLIKVITAMQVSDSWREFTRKLERIAPMEGKQTDMFAGAELKADPDLEPPK